MAQPASFRVFLSAVSNELASYRKELARVLRRKGLDVRDQEHFRQGGATLVEALRDYIQECDAVILLVGDQCGSLVEAEQDAVLGENAWFDRFQAASGCAQASYTQWEFLLAKQFGRKTYTFVTADGFQADYESKDTPSQQQCQTSYRAWIKQTGEHRQPLTSKAKLIEDVLVLPFPDLGRPKPNNLPYPSLGSLFKGREQFLADIHARLTKSDHAAAAITTRAKAVHGAGGIGKTRAAIEYAWRHAADYTALLFLAADSPAALESSLAGLVGALDLEGMDEANDEVRLAAVLAWLRSHPGWLAILDNVDTDDAAAVVKDRLSQLTDGHVLITSRIARWSAGVEKLDLDVLAVEDAAEYLLEAAVDRLRTDDDAATARAVAVRVGQLALGLEHAAAYINERQFSFAEYLKLWDEDEESILQEFDLSQIDYPHELLVTWKMSADRLDGDARKLLEIFSWLAPEPIPEAIFADLPEGMLSGDWRKAVAVLARYCLINRRQSGQERFLQLHRLVQATSRYHQRHAEATDSATPLPSLEDALRWMNVAHQGESNDVRTWPKLDPLTDHVLAICDFAERANKTTKDHATSRLLNDSAQLLHAKARYRAAEPLMRRALAIDEQSYGAEHPTVAVRLNNLAGVLQATNRLAEAEQLMRRALAIDELSYGTKHPKVARRLNNLAQLLEAANRLPEAEPLMRRGLAIEELSKGAEHPHVAIHLNNLAWLLRITNRLAEAEPLMRRALSINEQYYGAKHPRVAISLNDLAQLLTATKRLTEAEPMCRRALAIGEQSYGSAHPHVATYLNNLAQLLHDTHRLAEAEPLMRRAVEIFRASLGEEHPNTVKAAERYRLLLEAMG